MRTLPPWRTGRSPGSRAGILALLPALVLIGCTSQGGSGSGGGASPGNPAETLILGARVDNNSFDPADLEVGHRVQYWQPVYDTLLRLDENAVPQANVATAWTYNADNTALTLDLRDDVVFTDGSPLDGEAVRANLEHLREGSGQNQFMAAAIEEVAVLSPTQVELRLSEPVPSLLSYLGSVGGAMASPAALASDAIATEPVGSGPYLYDAEASTPGSEYRYIRNEDYWNAEAFPYDEYVVRPLNDLTPTLNALKTGEIDAAALEPAVAAEAEASGIALETRQVNWVGLLLADREGSVIPELADPRVRQAINLAVDREAMVEGILSGFGEPTSQTFNPASQAYVEELDGTYDYDPQRAQELMDQAGVEGFELTMPQWDGPWNDLFPVLADQLGEIGVTVTWERVPADQSVAEVLSGDYPAAFFPLGSASAWQDLQTWVVPQAPWNMLGAVDPELEQLVSEAQQADGAAQDAAFQEVNRFLVEQAWFAPLFRADAVVGTVAGTEVTTQAQNIVPFLWQYRPSDG